MRPDKDSPQSTERCDSGRPKAAERPDAVRRKAAERPDKDSTKSTQRRDKAGPVTTERPDKERPKTAERLDKRPEKGAPGRAQVSEQQRADIGAKLRQTRPERTHVQVDVNVGSRIPSTVRLRPLPSALVALAPAYRGHSYFVREDDTI